MKNNVDVYIDTIEYNLIYDENKVKFFGINIYDSEGNSKFYGEYSNYDNLKNSESLFMEIYDNYIIDLIDEGFSVSLYINGELQEKGDFIEIMKNNL